MATTKQPSDSPGVLEHALLEVGERSSVRFEAAFAEAKPLIGGDQGLSVAPAREVH